MYVAKNVEAMRKFHSIDEERRPKFVKRLTVLVFFAPAKYSNNIKLS